MKYKKYLLVGAFVIVGILGASTLLQRNNISQEVDAPNDIEVKTIDIKDTNEFFFEPHISIIEGKLITRMYYGPPGYGEDPKNDTKEYPYILQLTKPINVTNIDEEYVNEDASEVVEIHLAMSREELAVISKYKNKHLRVKGTLFSSYTGHHHTDVLMSVDEILN